MPGMEQIVRPFQDQDVGPTPYVPPGGAPDVPARVLVGMVGGTQTFTGKFSFTAATRIGAAHTETAPQSEALQKSLAKAAPTS